METHVSPLSTGTGKAMEEARPSIAKFQLSIKDAGNSYQGWVKKQSCVQKDIDIAGNLETIKRIWVPVWLFEVSAESAWHGQVSYTVNYTDYESVPISPHAYKQVAVSKERTEWRPASGNHYDNYFVPVSASGEITQEELKGLKFGHLDLKSYDESYLEGLPVQTTDLSKMGAKDTCNRLINDIERKVCKTEVESFGGCSTKVTYNTSTFALLPVFVLSYSHKDKFYRNLINGVSGEVVGDVPINKIKKFVFTVVKVIAGIILGLIVVFFFIALMGSH